MTNSFANWTDKLVERAEIFPHQLNLINDTVLLAELSAQELAAASFLDQRILKQTTKGAWVPWQLVADATDKAPTASSSSFIFHVGHCGSTLLSRLVAFAQDTQSLREPLPLRTLAQDHVDVYDGRSFLDRPSQQQRLRTLLRLWERGARHTVIKATSVCTDLLRDINVLQPTAKFVFVYNRAETHIATLLAGQNTLVDLRGFAQLRVQRLRQATGLHIQLSQLSHGQLAALSWLSETTSITRSLENIAAQIEPLEFETLLKHPASTLTHVLQHLEIKTDADQVDQAVRSPVLQTYSKAPEHQYNAHTRATILTESRSRFQQEIKDALSWLDILAGQSKLVTRALEKFG